MGNRPKTADSIVIDGTLIRKLREEAGLTQDLLASAVVNAGWHLRQGYLPGLEKKPAARVHKQLAEALAVVFEMTVSQLQPNQQVHSTSSQFAQTRQRPRGALRAPSVEEVSDVTRGVSADAITLGQRIDAILEENSLSMWEREEIGAILIPHATELARWIKLHRGK